MNKVEGCLSKFVYGVRTLDKTVPVRDAFPRLGEGKRLRGDRGTVVQICGYVCLGEYGCIYACVYVGGKLRMCVHLSVCVYVCVCLRVCVCVSMC